MPSILLSFDMAIRIPRMLNEPHALALGGQRTEGRAIWPQEGFCGVQSAGHEVLGVRCRRGRDRAALAWGRVVLAFLACVSICISSPRVMAAMSVSLLIAASRVAPMLAMPVAVCVPITLVPLRFGMVLSVSCTSTLASSTPVCLFPLLLFFTPSFLSPLLLVQAINPQILNHTLDNQPSSADSAHPRISRSTPRCQVLDTRCHLLLVVCAGRIWLLTLRH